MIVEALKPYEDCLLTPSSVLTAERPALCLVADDATESTPATELSLDVARYLGAVDATDEAVLDRCTGPVLDIGCGPGRFVRALGERGIAALGVDIADAAVELTRRLGMPALGRSIFDAMPGEGRWPTVLLMDGNLGIGGNVPRLLARVGEMLHRSGRAIIESSAERDVDEVLSVRFSSGGHVVGPSFDWARMGIDALAVRAQEAGFYVDEEFEISGRSFLCIARASRMTVTR